MDKEILEKIEAQQGDITRLAVDAIVNAANTKLLGGGGVDGAIHRAAGPQLLEECRTIGGCPTGEARITRGYNLPARYVIHTVGPVYSESKRDPIDLRNSFRNSLRLADENKLKSIAFPAVSAGIFGYPIESAAEIAMTTIRDYLDNEKEKGSIKLVRLVLFSVEDFNIFKEKASEVFHGA